MPALARVAANYRDCVVSQVGNFLYSRSETVERFSRGLTEAAYCGYCQVMETEPNSAFLIECRKSDEPS